MTNSEWSLICAKKPKNTPLDVKRVVEWTFTKAFDKTTPHRMLWSFIQATYKNHPDWFVISPLHDGHISVRIENLGGIGTHWCSLHINMIDDSSFVKNVTMINWNDEVIELLKVYSGKR